MRLPDAQDIYEEWDIRCFMVIVLRFIFSVWLYFVYLYSWDKYKNEENVNFIGGIHLDNVKLNVLFMSDSVKMTMFVLC